MNPGSGIPGNEKVRKDRKEWLLLLLSLLLAFIVWLIHSLSLQYSVFLEYRVTLSTSIEGRSRTATSEDILIVAPSICFDGTVYGFSMLKDANFYVEYRGVRWVYSDVGEESSTGTIEASVGDGSITLSFYNLKKGQDTLEGYYSGALTIAE